MRQVAVPAVLAGLALALLVGRSGGAARLASVLGRRDRPSAAGRHDLPGTAGSGPGPMLRTLPQTLLRVPRGSRRGGALLAAAGGLFAGIADGPVLALVVAVLTATLVSALARRDRTRSAAVERAGAAEACAALAAELRAGRSPAQALSAASEVAAGGFRQRLRAGASAAGLGGDVAGALDAGAATAVPELAAALAACWQVCAGTGSGLAAAVERLEEGLAHREAARRAVEAELAGPRATAGLLAVLPLAGIGLAAGLGARPVHVLLHTSVGRACLLLGVGLDLAGLAWSRRIAASAGL